MNFDLLNIAYAATETETVAEVGQAIPVEEHSGGLSIDPYVVGAQVFNLLILMAILRWILYKPLMSLLAEREEKIKKGVEHAEEAEVLLKESSVTRDKMLKEARAEGQTMVESARKSGEQIRTDILAKAQDEAQQIITSGKELVHAERAKVIEEVKVQTVEIVMKAAEKLLKEKMDAVRDAKMIKDSIESYAK